MGFISISVCIPCIYDHIKYLPDCIESIYSQTFYPHEIIVVISNIPEEDLHKTKIYMDGLQKKYPILIYDLTTAQNYAGTNRNRAVELAQSKIITFIDADDLMRYDRLYILQKIFNMDPDVIGVIHTFYENKFPLSEHKNINFDKEFIKDYAYSQDLHFGHATFLKKLFNEYKYSDKPRGQDIELVHNILEKYIKKLRIYTQPLTYYISSRSTFYK